MTMEAAENAINKLMTARWLKVVDGNSKLALDVRFVGEMESWMVEIIGADKMAYCKSCHKLVVRGVYCDNCDTVAWHLYCLEKVASGGKEESEEEEMSQSQVVKSSGSRIKRGFSGDSDSDSD